MISNIHPLSSPPHSCFYSAYLTQYSSSFSRLNLPLILPHFCSSPPHLEADGDGDESHFWFSIFGRFLQIDVHSPVSSPNPLNLPHSSHTLNSVSHFHPFPEVSFHRADHYRYYCWALCQSSFHHLTAQLLDISKMWSKTLAWSEWSRPELSGYSTVWSTPA